MEKKLCPKCEDVYLSFAPETKNKIISVHGIKQEVNWDAKYFCRKCDYKEALKKGEK